LSLNSLLDQGVTILTASRRLAHALRLGYARYAQAQGRQVWASPEILPWSAWLRQARLEARAAGAPESLAPVLTSAQARIVWDEVVSGSVAARELMDASNAARMAARSWRRMQDYLIPLERLRSFDAPEAQALHAWCEGFLQRCNALGAIDEARLSEWMLNSQFVPPVRIALAGFDVVPPAMKLLIDRWRTHERIVDTHTGAEATAQVLLTTRVVGAPDADAEVELAAQWARAQLEQGAEAIGVILPDLQSRREAVRRAFEDAFAPGQRHVNGDPASIPVVIAAPAALADYPAVDAALLILQLAATQCTSTLVGRILRSPFVAGGDAERGKRALADLELRELQRDRWDWFELERWAGMTGCERLLLAGRELTTLLRGITGSATASQWVERFHSMLQRIGWPGDRTPGSVEHQTLEKFHAALAEFGTFDAVAGRMTMAQALRRLQDLLHDTPFEPETATAAVTVIDATTSAGMRFDALWVAGLDADRFPAPVNPDPLIPLELQRAAAIPEASATEVLQLATKQLQRWRAGSDVLVLSWPQRAGDAEAIVSPLIADLPPSPAQAPLQPRTLRQLAFERRPQLATLLDENAPPLASAAAKGGARVLELQSHCPFRAQAELRLGAAPMPRVGLGVAPLDRGAILHGVLAEIWGSLGTQHALLEIDDLSLEEQVREATMRIVAHTLQPATRYRNRLASLEVETMVRQVMYLLIQERMRPPFSVRFAEAEEQYRIGGLAIKLRPDRIDELANGAELLIDYKLGDSHKPRDWIDAWPGRPRRPQLPLYGLAHADTLGALAYVVLAPGAVEYRGWSNGTDVGMGVLPYPAGLRIDLGDPQDWQALMDQWRFSLTRLAERFVAGEARVDPLPLVCQVCHLSTLCRIHERAPAEAAGESDDD
jgi:probable DNA repair protein